MNGWLLDTNLISVFAPGKRPPPRGLGDWLEARNEDLYLGAPTISEIESGISKLQRVGAVARARLLSAWFEGLIAGYGDRVLPFDLAAARAAGAIVDAAIGLGFAPDFADGAIAGIAQARSLVVLTYNLKHFRPFGVSAASPDELILA